MAFKFLLNLKYRLFTCVFFLSFFVSNNCFAYFYYIGNQEPIYKTPDSACSAYAKQYKHPYYETRGLTTCHVSIRQDINGSSYSISRTGVCNLDENIFNSETGACEPKPKDCSPTIGEQLAARGPNVPVFLDGEGKRFLAGSDFSGACFDGCYYEKASSRTLRCFLVSGSTDTGFCNYRVEGNGTSCPASTGEPAGGGDPLNPTDPPPTDPEEPDEPDPGCPPPFIFNGTFCQSKPGDGGGDGNGDGGGSGGGGGSSGGGSGDGGGGDGGGSGSDGDGSGDGGKGDGSSSSGDGSGGSGGNGNGDRGDGDCSGKDCVGGEYGKLSRPEQGTFDDSIKEYDQKIEGINKEVSDLINKFGVKAKEKINVNLAGGAGTLPCSKATVFGTQIEFCLSNFALDLSVIRDAILFMAAVLALFIIFGRGSRD